MLLVIIGTPRLINKHSMFVCAAALVAFWIIMMREGSTCGRGWNEQDIRSDADSKQHARLHAPRAPLGESTGDAVRACRRTMESFLLSFYAASGLRRFPIHHHDQQRRQKKVLTAVLCVCACAKRECVTWMDLGLVRCDHLVDIHILSFICFRDWYREGSPTYGLYGVVGFH